jgi:hypothetical protein
MKTNTQIITREFAEQNILFFYPATTEQATQILQKLFDMGFLWGNTGNRDLVSYTKKCVIDGMVVLGGRTDGISAGLYTAGGHTAEGWKARGLLCTLDQFSAVTAPVPTPQILEEIRALREEMTTVRQELADMRAEMATERKSKSVDKRIKI